VYYTYEYRHFDFWGDTETKYPGSRRLTSSGTRPSSKNEINRDSRAENLCLSNVRSTRTLLCKSTRPQFRTGISIIVKEIIVISIKEDCAHYFATRFRTNANWRRGQFGKFPCDTLNALAAQQLLELKSEIEISDASGANSHHTTTRPILAGLQPYLRPTAMLALESTPVTLRRGSKTFCQI
jgi:hypothetical protein